MTFSITLPLETNDARTALVGVPSAERSRAYQRIVERLRALPGVRGASAITLLPLDRSVNGSNTEVAGAGQIGIDYPWVLSNFFETMDIPIVQGRGFESTDAASGGWVTVVNEALANTRWKGQIRSVSGCGPRAPKTSGSRSLASPKTLSRRGLIGLRNRKRTSLSINS